MYESRSRPALGLPVGTLLCVLAAGVLSAQPRAFGTPNCQPGGTDPCEPGELWKIDLMTAPPTTMLLTTTPLTDPANQPNAEALDHSNGRFYYAQALGGDLYYWIDTGDGTPNDDHVFLGNFESFPPFPADADPNTPNLASAAFYAGDYYFIPETTDDLWRVTFSEGPLSISGVGKVGDLTGNARGWRFGDIAIDSGILYGSGQRTDNGQIELFSYDLTNLSNPCCLVTIRSAPSATFPLLQLTFDAPANITLYGFNAANGEVFTVDTATGVLSSRGIAVPPVGFRDVGGVPVELQSFTINGE